MEYIWGLPIGGSLVKSPEVNRSNYVWANWSIGYLSGGFVIQEVANLNVNNDQQKEKGRANFPTRMVVKAFGLAQILYFSVNLWEAVSQGSDV